VWKVGLTVEIKLCFQISPAWCGRSLKLANNVFESYDESLDGNSDVGFFFIITAGILARSLPNFHCQ